MANRSDTAKRLTISAFEGLAARKATSTDCALSDRRWPRRDAAGEVAGMEFAVPIPRRLRPVKPRSPFYKLQVTLDGSYPLRRPANRLCSASL